VQIGIDLQSSSNAVVVEGFRKANGSQRNSEGFWRIGACCAAHDLLKDNVVADAVDMGVHQVESRVDLTLRTVDASRLMRHQRKAQRHGNDQTRQFPHTLPHKGDEQCNPCRALTSGSTLSFWNT
jgi:hypothetical protein